MCRKANIQKSPAPSSWNYYPTVATKTKSVSSINHDQKDGERLPWKAAFLLFMKKFLTFLFFLILLIICEYFLVTELFFAKRLPVLLISLLGSVVFFYAAYRFFKKNILTAKHS